jgi:hypothetical protein
MVLCMLDSIKTPNSVLQSRKFQKKMIGLLVGINLKPKSLAVQLNQTKATNSLTMYETKTSTYQNSTYAIRWVKLD